MKIQLDTELKTIKLEDATAMGTLVDFLEKILPNGEWKTYKLETYTVISNWTYPIVYRDHDWWYPNWDKPTRLMCGGSTVTLRNGVTTSVNSDNLPEGTAMSYTQNKDVPFTLTSKKGVYNLEVN